MARLPLVLSFVALAVSASIARPELELKLKPLLSQPEELIFAEEFDAFGAKWHAGHGDWTFEAGHARGASRAADHHGADYARNQKYRDAIFQLVFKFDGSKTIDLNLIKSDSAGKREHVGKVIWTTSSMKLLAQTGIGPTTKNTTVAEKPAKLADGQWHTALIEVIGDEIAVQLDTGDTARAKHEMFDVDKSGLTLSLNGAAGLFDDLKVWKAVRKAGAR